MRAHLPAALLAAFALAACGQSSQQQASDGAAEALRDAPLPAKRAVQPMLGKVLTQLAPDAPALKAHIAGIDAEERRLLAEAMAALDQRAGTGRAAARSLELRPTRRAASSGSIEPSIWGWLIPAAHAQGSFGDGGGFVTGANSASILGGNAGSLSRNGPSGSESRTFTGRGGERVTLGVDVAGDKTVTTSVESNVKIAQLGAEANGTTSVSARDLCPDTEGRVKFTTRVRRSGSVAGGPSVEGKIEVRIEIVVNEQAEIASSLIEASYDVSATNGGKPARATGRFQSAAGEAISERAYSTEDATLSDVEGQMQDAAIAEATALGIGAIQGAESHWRTGYCMKIDATSPGTVAPNTVSTIDVKTFLRSEPATTVRSSVTATLSGGASIDPGKFAGPGSFKHVAVGEKNKVMSIKLRATSRRGADEMTLKIDTAQRQYSIEGGGGEFRGSGVICDITKPFTVRGNANIVVNFTPSGDRGGSYSYTGSIAGAALFGSGTYAVVYDGDIPVRVTAGGPGSARGRGGTFTRSDSESYTLTPVSGRACD